jgi:hypothetical protein
MGEPSRGIPSQLQQHSSIKQDDPLFLNCHKSMLISVPIKGQYYEKQFYVCATYPLVKLLFHVNAG